MDLLLKPVRLATSKPARQTYLNTVLFMITSAILLGLAVIAYVLFYFNYVPQIGVERVVHLQYGDGPHPYGIASLDSSLVHDQAYDISLSLHVPRSPPNLAAGNFMLSLSLLSPSYTPASTPSSPPSPPTIPSSVILFSTRRPALLTYTSRLISLSSRLLTLPLYLLNLKLESETLHVPMAESLRFGRGAIPAHLLLELQAVAGAQLQVYDARVRFTARFAGLRWVMYNYRFVAAGVFISAFWGVEMLCAGVGWVVIRALFAPKHIKTKKEKMIKEEEEEGTDEDEDKRVKKEEEEEEGLLEEDPDLSDTPRTFPTYGRQAPLRYIPKVKREDIEDENDGVEEQQRQEADDENEDEGVGLRTDSGIGTSFSEGVGGAGLARRRSRGGRVGGGS